MIETVGVGPQWEGLGQGTVCGRVGGRVGYRKKELGGRNWIEGSVVGKRLAVGREQSLCFCLESSETVGAAKCVGSITTTVPQTLTSS